MQKWLPELLRMALMWSWEENVSLRIVSSCASVKISTAERAFSAGRFVNQMEYYSIKINAFITCSFFPH